MILSSSEKGNHTMTKEEFLKRMKEDTEWAPGWEAIEQEFARLYPHQEPKHYATLMTARAILGGNEFLDGYSVYQSPKGFLHIVTFGMTELYAEEDAFGGEWNKWGYEMTFKLKEQDAEHCLWAIDMLSNLARYTYTTKRFFEPYQYIAGNGKSLHIEEDSAITALLTVPDTEARTLNTLYGKTEFIQLVGITEQELEAVKSGACDARTLCSLMQAYNPDLVTDMRRTKSYL